jgi:hypothetical protein
MTNEAAASVAVLLFLCLVAWLIIKYREAALLSFFTLLAMGGLSWLLQKCIG